jgi:replication factor C large subunit
VGRSQVDLQLLDALGYRDREKLIFDALRNVFQGRSVRDMRANLEGVDVDPETMLLWIAENLPREYRSVEDLVNGYEMLSKADIFFGRVSRRQYYGLWSYACDLMSGGVAVAKTRSYGSVQYGAPQWMSMMRQSRSLREARGSVSEKLGRLVRCSRKKTMEFFLPEFRQMFCRDIRFACLMKQRLVLSETEIKYLLGSTHGHKLKEIMEYCGTFDEHQSGLDTTNSAEKKEKEEPSQPRSEVNQPSLFDF